MSNITNPLDIIKRLDVKQNVTIRVIDEATNKVVQEHIGHNAATNSLLTGIAHYLMGDGVLNQGADTLSMWVPQYISLGTMGLTSQDSETYTEESSSSGETELVTYIVPAGVGYTPAAPANTVRDEKRLNEELRFSEYVNQTPGFGADGYDNNANNDREWFGLGYPYSLKPDAITQDFYTWDGSETTFQLSKTPITIISVTLFPGGEVNQDIHTYPDVERLNIKSEKYSVDGKNIHFSAYNPDPEAEDTATIPADSRLAIVYTYKSKDAVNCELIKAEVDVSGNIVPLTLRSKVTYRDLVPEFQSEVPNTLDVIYSAMISTGALKDFRGNNDYIYITEAGLWSKPGFTDSGDNGMLAGYRIMPTDDNGAELGVQETFTGDGTTKTFYLSQHALSITSVTVDGVAATEYELDKDNNAVVFTGEHAPETGAEIIVLYGTTNSWKDMTNPDNRRKVQENILRVGVNQVVQVIWKLQLGGLQQLNGLRYIYPSQYPEEVWELRK